MFFLLLLAVLCAVRFRLPQYIVSEREKTLTDWTNGCAAWRVRDYGTAAKCWRMNFVRSFLVRRPSKYLYWQAEAFQKLGETEKAASVRSRLLSKYPLDYYSFRLVRGSGGVNGRNKKQLFDDISEIFRMPYETEVAAAAKKSGVDRALVWAVMKRESKFSPDAVSSSGAVGLMQLMPGTARETAKKAGIGKFSLYEPRDNIMLGALQLSTLLKRFDGNVIYALAAYNAGAAKAASWRGKYENGEFWVEEIPFAETREFVRCVYENYAVYRMLLTE